MLACIFMRRLCVVIVVVVDADSLFIYYKVFFFFFFHFINIIVNDYTSLHSVANWCKLWKKNVLNVVGIVWSAFAQTQRILHFI